MPTISLRTSLQNHHRSARGNCPDRRFASMAGDFILHGRPGWGLAIDEMQLAFYKLPFRIVDGGDLFESSSAREMLEPLNPLAQLPILVLPDGSVMTESAAITIHLTDMTQSIDLVPPGQASERAAFPALVDISCGKHLSDIHVCRSDVCVLCTISEGRAMHTHIQNDAGAATMSGSARGSCRDLGYIT